MTSSTIPGSTSCVVSGGARLATAVVAPVHPRETLTEINYGKTLAWSVGAILVCLFFYCIEKYVAMPAGWISDVHHRMFKNPAELPMRLFGLPHFIVGFTFQITSSRMRGVRSVGRLTLLAAIGVGLCFMFYSMGAHNNPLALILFYFYFLIHGFRDEVFFYRTYGDMPKEAQQTHRRIIAVLQAVLLGLLMSLFIPALMLYSEYKPRYRVGALEAIFPAEWPFVARFLVCFIPMSLIACFALWRISRAFPDGLAGLWRVHRPILRVFAVATVIILLALVSGPWSFNLVVLMHFVGWYIFGRHMMQQRQPKTEPGSLWQKARTTLRGFSVFHLGLAALVIVLVMISTFAFGKTGPLEMFVGSKAFYYWTVIHVTLSFLPR